jgi:protein-S-isoprenylcysteine O-methyltransferase Ste14
MARNRGIKAVWAVSAIVISILVLLFVGSLSYIFGAQITQMLQYLSILLAVVSILVLL